jgi:hypothetical protein
LQTPEFILAMWERPSFDVLVDSISDPSNPIGMRMRAAYYLRQAYETSHNEKEEETESKQADHEDDGHEPTNDTKTTCTTHTSTTKADVIALLCRELQNRSHGSLLRHEFAYVLGQLRDAKADTVLQQVLLDATDCVMVRHEGTSFLSAVCVMME